MTRLWKAFLESEGPLSTPALARRVMVASGLDAGDKVLAETVGHKIVFDMRAQHLRGKIGDAGRAKGARLWPYQVNKTGTTTTSAAKTGTAPIGL